MPRVTNHTFGEGEYGFAMAASNQYVFDQLYYKLLNLSAEDFNGLPRPSKWVKKNTLATKALRLISGLIAFSWCYFFSYIYIATRFLMYLPIGKRVVNRPGESINTLALAICDRSCAVLSSIITNSENIVWITPPGVKLSENTSKTIGSNVFDATSFLSRREMLEACKQAYAAHRYLVAEYGIGLGLQSYAVAEWMLMFRALAVISPNKILTAEHHDRWAVMADFYCSIVKENGNRCHFELAQHGKEYESTYQDIESITNKHGLPYRLKNLCKLHVYNHEQFSIFTKNIISLNLFNENNFLVDYLPFQINLTECSGDELKVLIVGHPICENFQVRLYNSLFLEKKITCFYKPHPTAAASSKIKSIGWRFISDDNFFPNVDLIISYPSTLTDEYKMAGIPSLVHSLRDNEENFDDFIRDANVCLDRLLKKRAGIN